MIVVDTGPIIAGTADAIVVAITERFGAVSVATLDHRHFSVVRPSHVAALTLLP